MKIPIRSAGLSSGKLKAAPAVPSHPAFESGSALPDPRDSEPRLPPVPPKEIP